MGIEPTTQITGAHAVLKAMLTELVGKDGAFDTLMQLTRGFHGENLLQLFATELKESSEKYQALFSHHGLGGEFGNGIGSVLMHTRERMARNDQPEAINNYAERLRWCWRDKFSKATEYTDQSEKAGDAMWRLGRELREYAYTAQVAPGFREKVDALITKYEKALSDIESCVELIETLKPVPQTLGQKPEANISR